MIVVLIIIILIIVVLIIIILIIVVLIIIILIMLWRRIKKCFGKISDLKQSQKMILDKSRQLDYSNYILAGYYPRQIRQDFINIGWFNQELMRCVENVKEKSISINKLEFWSDQVQKIYQNTASRNEPITVCL